MVCKVRKNKVHESSVRRATEVGNLLTDIFFDIESPSGLTVLKRGSPYTELNTFCLSWDELRKEKFGGDDASLDAPTTL